MRDLYSIENYNALVAGSIVPRDFLSFMVRTRDTGDAVWDHMWSDVGSIVADVIDPDSGGVQSRAFTSAASLVEISDLPVVTGLTVQTLTITLSQVADRVNQLVRGYDCNKAVVQLFRGLFDPETSVLVAPAFPRFAGIVDSIKIRTPPAGQSGSVVMSCVSASRELRRSNPDTRSHASQQLRAPEGEVDDFFITADVVSTWPLFWAKETGPIPTVAARRISSIR